MRGAFLAALTLHAGAIALLVAFAGPRPPAEAPDQGAGIAVVFSAGGGGETVGEDEAAIMPWQAAAERLEAETQGEAAQERAAQEQAAPEQAAAAPVTAEAGPTAPPSEIAAAPLPAAALPLPPPPPPEPPPEPPPSRQRLTMQAAPAPASPRGEATVAARSGAEGEVGAALPGAASLLLAARPATVGHRVDPVVPVEARRARMQGTVLLAVTISPEGVPSAVDVSRSSGHVLLDRAAQEALWQWRFDPARRGGVAVEERIAVPVTFRIVD